MSETNNASDHPITHEDIEALRGITPPRKSVMNFSDDDVAGTGAFVAKFQREIGDKSPYQRRLEDWREAEDTAVAVVTVEEHDTQNHLADIKNGTIWRGNTINIDTGYEIVIGSKGLRDTLAYSKMDLKRKRDTGATVNAIYHLRTLVEGAVSLDTQAIDEKNSNSPNALFMHKLYAPFVHNGVPYVARISVEEDFKTNKNDEFEKTHHRFYNLRNIKTVPLTGMLSEAQLSGFQSRAGISTTAIISVAQLFALVKEYDRGFYRNPAAPGRVERLAEIASQSPHREDRQYTNDERSDRPMDEMNTPYREEGAAAPEAQPKRKEQILTENLQQGVRDLMDSEKFKNYLATSGRLYFNNYSFRNAMLLYLQKPDASHVMGFEQWKDFGRIPGKGSTGAAVMIPVMASEKEKGSLYAQITKGLNERLEQSPSAPNATYRLGQSNIFFTKNRANGLVSVDANGKGHGIFNSADSIKQYIDRNILGKTPMYYNVGTVFDVKDTVVPDHLWVKTGYNADDVVFGEDGKPVTNDRGEVKIVNTPERQARFQPALDMTVAAQDPVKMEKLLGACIAASERKGVPVYLRDASTDDGLKDAKGYYSRADGCIVIDKTLEITEQCTVMFHEMGHADLHSNLKKLAERMGEEKVPQAMREIQAEAAAYMTAASFGIETDTHSFAYLAGYTNDFEMQDFQKSLEVIYKECRALTNDIRVELDLRGMNLDLSEKPATEPMDKSSVDALARRCMDVAKEAEGRVAAAMGELNAQVEAHKGSPEVMDVLKEEKRSLRLQTEDIGYIRSAVGALKNADTREAQNGIVDKLDAACKRIGQNAAAFGTLSARLAEIRPHGEDARSTPHPGKDKREAAGKKEKPEKKPGDKAAPAKKATKKNKEER